MTRLPSPQNRLPAPQHPKRLRPKTYSVAVYLVGAVVLLQVAMVISVFWLRAMIVPVNFKLPRALTGQASAPLPPTALPTPTPHPAATAASKLPELPELSTGGPHLALLSVPDLSDTLSRINNLNDQAQQSLRENDLKSAAELLVKAEDMDPRNPTTLKNLAEVYYLMNNAVRAKQYWQRLVDLGPGVGTVYALAKDHVLLLSSTHDADTLKAPSIFPRLIYIDGVEKTPVETANAQSQFHLRTVLMRKDLKMLQFDQKKLRPYVIFYQQMPDGSLAPDLNQHGGSFEDTFLFWGTKTHEPFGVDYIMPVVGSPGPNNTKQGEYYGFVIGIYYNNQLQDARSEPDDLIARMPLPAEIE